SYRRCCAMIGRIAGRPCCRPQDWNRCKAFWIENIGSNVLRGKSRLGGLLILLCVEPGRRIPLSCGDGDSKTEELSVDGKCSYYQGRALRTCNCGTLRRAG